MDKERIWAPWRIDYVAGDDSKEPLPEPVRWQDGADRKCFLCQAAATFNDPQADRRRLVIEADDSTVVVMNRYPYTNGHLLVSPLRHVADLAELTESEVQSSVRQMSRFTKLLADLIRAEGFNIGLNLGSAAGAGVPGHLHWHLVPRWLGDTNFMATTAGTRVISQSLDALWDAIRTRIAN